MATKSPGPFFDSDALNVIRIPGSPIPYSSSKRRAGDLQLTPPSTNKRRALSHEATPSPCGCPSKFMPGYKFDLNIFQFAGVSSPRNPAFTFSRNRARLDFVPTPSLPVPIGFKLVSSSEDDHASLEPFVASTSSNEAITSFQFFKKVEIEQDEDLWSVIPLNDDEDVSGHADVGTSIPHSTETFSDDDDDEEDLWSVTAVVDDLQIQERTKRLRLLFSP